MNLPDIDRLTKLVEDAKLDVPVEIESMHPFLQEVKFEKSGEFFTWCGMRSWKNTRMTGWIFPMRNANYVKFFKTLKGCKKNFLKTMCM